MADVLRYAELLVMVARIGQSVAMFGGIRQVAITVEDLFCPRPFYEGVVRLDELADRRRDAGARAFSTRRPLRAPW